MYNNIVSDIFNKLIQNNFSCLRFNFRAVGSSTGDHSSGRGELSDVKACIDYLIEKKKCERLLICGYSYGAAIGCAAINHSDKILGYVAISFPWDYLGTKYKNLSQSIKPKLFIQGDQDDIAKFSRFESHYEDYQDPKEHRIIKGADHFYWGYEEQVSNNILDFIITLNIKNE